MSGTILRLGYSDPLTGVFGAHPQLGAVVDLNDGVTFTLERLAIEPATRTVITAGNVRTSGERGVRGVYRHNRRMTAELRLGPMGTWTDLAATVRVLVAWMAAPPDLTVALSYQPLGASSPVYLDVVAAAHDIPPDEAQWLRLELESLEVTFVCRPTMRGDRQWLQNLVVNPGFEVGSGPAVFAFGDAFVNTNAYSLTAGAAPTVAANVMTLAAGAQVAFGSPAWGAINVWQVRFQFTGAGNVSRWYLHYTDANNSLRVQVFTGAGGLQLFQQIAGVDHSLATASPTLVVNNWYWLQITQFPTVPGDPAYVQATLLNDNAGVPGSQVATVAGPTSDAVTALTGRPQILASAGTLPIGGAFASVHQLSLFGPGGWSFSNNNGTGIPSGAWERGGASTYPGGPATSFGAARIDVAPAGTLNAYCSSYQGGAPAGTTAIPVNAPGNVLSINARTKSTGLSVTASILLVANEYDSAGTFLRATTLQTLNGNQPAWTLLAGTLITGANCAFVFLFLEAVDATANSANGTVWFDNVQAWNQTATGMATMPYCELRFPQAPSALLVSGLLGDVSVPASVLLGAYEASWASGGSLSLALGRRAAFHPSAVLVGASNGWYGPVGIQVVQSTAALDTSAWGGYYALASLNVNNSWNPLAFSAPPATLRGTYHLLQRFLTREATLSALQVRVVTAWTSQAWFGLGATTTSWVLATVNGSWLVPVTAANAWLALDAGQIVVPPEPLGALGDLTLNDATPRPQWWDTTAGGAVQQINWQALLPTDASLLLGVVNNPSNSSWAPSGWVYVYLDGLGVPLGGQATAGWSVEPVALPSPAHGGGGPGTASSGPVNVNLTADPYLTLDPTLGSNQLVASLADSTGAVLPLVADILYTPQYLEPR